MGQGKTFRASPCSQHIIPTSKGKKQSTNIYKFYRLSAMEVTMSLSRTASPSRPRVQSGRFAPTLVAYAAFAVSFAFAAALILGLIH